ncbi:RNA polymerase sigma factor [Desulfofalx alkaliphila]|uniref:RNA polymerase sigma factor n=1 Tax=Desulfofalx alkaliphila TaxID=105483 RepID=UPI00068B1EEA|nr:sigma-70 family RNA polymerase sigma factor [Desulfofalx alkaliphila]
MIAADVYKKAAEGDPKAIEKICVATWEPLYRFIYYKVQNREDAEDVTQETYVKTLSYMQKNKAPQENFLGFMKTVSLNIIRDRWRKEKRGGVLVNFQQINPAETAAGDQQNAIAQRLLLEGAMAKLSQEQQTILELRIIKGYSVAETAKLLGKTEGAVRTAQHRALQALSRLLDDKELQDQKGEGSC